MRPTAVELAAAYVSLIPSTNKLAPAVRGQLDKTMPREGQRAGSKLGGALAGAAAKVAKGALIGAGVAAGAALLSGLKAGVNIQEAQRTLAGLYGSTDQATRMMQRLRDVASKSPIDYNAYTKGAQSLAYMGIKGDQAVGILENVGAAVVTAGTGSEGMSRATDAMLKMVNAGKVQLDTLNQLSDAGVPIFSGLAAHFNTNIANVRDMVTAGKVGIDDVMSVVEKAQGGTFQQMVRASKTASTSVSAQFKILKDNTATTLGFMFQPALNALATWMAKLNGAVKNMPAGISGVFGWFQRVAAVIRDKLGPPLAAWGRVVLPLLAGAWRDLSSAVGSLFRGLAPLVPVLKLIGIIVGGVLLAALTIIIGVFRVVAFVLKTVTVPILRVLIAVLGAVASFILKNTAPVFRWLYRNVILPVWTGIKVVIRGAWAVIKAIFTAIRFVIMRVLAPVFRWLYRNVVKPVWTLIRIAIKVAWVLIRVIFGLMKIGIRALAVVFRWLYRNVIQPVWRAISTVIRVVWRTFIRPVFTAIAGFLRRTLGPVFRWLWRNVISPVWNGIKRTISTVWNSGIKPVFNALWRFVRHSIPNAFRKGVDAVGAAWRKVQSIAKKPVSFILRTVIQKGIVGGFNKIAGVFGVKKIKFTVPKGFRAGGAARGPGGKTGDKIPAWLSNDEHVWTAREVAGAGGHKAVERMRAAAAAGQRMPFARGGRSSLVAFGKWLRSKGARVGEGPAPFGPVHRVHASNSWHYRQGAIDVNYGPGGTSGTEQAFFDRIIKSGIARKNYGLRSIWRYPGHYNHAHFDIAPGPDMGMAQSGKRGLLAGLADAAGAIANPFKGLLAKAKKALAPYAKMGEVTVGAAKKMVSGAWEWVKAHNPFAGIGEGNADAGGARRWAPIVKRVLKELGLPARALQPVLHRINQESGGNPRAVNNWDVNARRGTPSKGLMQTIGPTFNAYAGKYRGRGIYDPLANIYAGINYARHRYGRGWIRRMTAPGGYDNGGMLYPGVPGINRTSRPEPVLTDRQWANVRAYLPTDGGGAAGQQPLVHTVNIEARAGDEHALMNEFAWKLRTIRRGGVYATA